MSPGTDDGNGDGRGAIGVTAGAVAIGAGGMTGARGGSAVLAFGAGADLALGFAALGAGFFAAARFTFLALTFLALTVFRRAGAAFALRLTAFFFAFRFFAISLSLLPVR